MEPSRASRTGTETVNRQSAAETERMASMKPEILYFPVVSLPAKARFLVKLKYTLKEIDLCYYSYLAYHIEGFEEL